MRFDAANLLLCKTSLQALLRRLSGRYGGLDPEKMFLWQMQI
jgi:hypothetical protein